MSISKITRCTLSAVCIVLLILLAGCQNGVGISVVEPALSPDQKILKRWVDARAGTGEPVHYVSEGGVYAYPSGEKLFGMIGFDSSTVIWPENPADPVLHLTRKTFAYSDPITGEVLTEYNGKPVVPIAYPYQLIRYRVENGIIYGDVEQGVEPNIQTIKAKNGMRSQMLGADTMFVNASVFLDFALPSGAQYEAWENYDFFFQNPDKSDRPYQLTWQRYGALPKWAGDGRAIYHLLSWRVDKQSDFPEKLLSWAKGNKPEWLNPPRDLEEIRSLQKGEELEGWAR